ncbi:hypothetical protein APR12_001361 [Nocardia amikacinitolerans]|nr:hypothetical protein [Nocardia amikacinitolerans]
MLPKRKVVACHCRLGNISGVQPTVQVAIHFNTNWESISIEGHFDEAGPEEHRFGTAIGSVSIRFPTAPIRFGDAS